MIIKCRAGNKPCGKRCIPNEWDCGEKDKTGTLKRNHDAAVAVIGTTFVLGAGAAVLAGVLSKSGKGDSLGRVFERPKEPKVTAELNKAYREDFSILQPPTQKEAKNSYTEPASELISKMEEVVDNEWVLLPGANSDTLEAAYERDEFNNRHKSKDEYLTNVDMVNFGKKSSEAVGIKTGVGQKQFMEWMVEDCDRFGKNLEYYDSLTDLGDDLISKETLDIFRDRKIDPKDVKVILIDGIDTSGAAPNEDIVPMVNFLKVSKTFSIPEGGQCILVNKQVGQEAGLSEHQAKAETRSVVDHECVHAMQMLSGWMFTDVEYEQIKTIVENDRVPLHNTASFGSISDNYNNPGYASQYWEVSNNMRSRIDNKDFETYQRAAKRMEVEAWAIGNGPSWIADRARGYDSDYKRIRRLGR
jgi:hypothetical protein